MLRRSQVSCRLLRLACRHSFQPPGFAAFSTQQDGTQQDSQQQLAELLRKAFTKDPSAASNVVAEALSPTQRSELLSSIYREDTKPLMEQKLKDPYVSKLFESADEEYPKGLLSRGEFAKAMLMHQARNDVQDSTEPLPWKTLLRVALTRGIPFVAFGFSDNFIMIMAGEEIESTLGVPLGLSTMAAAGLGNLFADVAGISIANSLEENVRRYKFFRDTVVSRSQRHHTNFKVAQWLGAALGVMIGCVLGLLPLLFMDKAFKKVDEEGQKEGQQERAEPAAT